MTRLLAIICLLAFAMFEPNTSFAQRGYRAPLPPGGGGLAVPGTPLPDVNLRGTLDTHEPKPVIRVPPPVPKVEKRPETGMCCPCRGTKECSDVCCLRQ